MMKIKTSELTDTTLDWAVAEAGGLGRVFLAEHLAGCKYRQASTDRAYGGLIMDEAEIDTYCHERGSPFGWHAEITGTKFKGRGQTRLIAAMRCYVASKLGDTVEIPEELLK